MQKQEIKKNFRISKKDQELIKMCQRALQEWIDDNPYMYAGKVSETDVIRIGLSITWKYVKEDAVDTILRIREELMEK